MIYKFKSKATGDTLMLGPQGDALLRLLGREPAAIAALQRAVVEDEAARHGEATDEADEPGGTGRDPVSLRRRLWPMVEMLKRSHAAGEPVVWGV